MHTSAYKGGGGSEYDQKDMHSWDIICYLGASFYFM